MSRRERHLALAAWLALAAQGCGGWQTPDQQSEESAGGAERTIADQGAQPSSATTGATEVESIPGTYDPIVAVEQREPSPWQGLAWMIAPATPHVFLAEVALEPRQSFRPPASACQDVILFVREGQLEASGTGIAAADAPVTLYPGDAVRFGPEGDGTASNVGVDRARTVMAVARNIDAGAPRLPAPDDDRCDPTLAGRDPLRRPMRVGSLATTPPLRAANGRLEVRILIDGENAGAQHGALSWLDGAPDLVVPEHRHPGSAEILFIEDGEGTMRLGDREIAVHPGDALYIPEDVLHSFRGAGSRPLRAVQIYAPAGPEQRFRAP